MGPLNRWLVVAVLAPAAAQAEIVVQNGVFRLTLGDNGVARELVEKRSGTNWLSSRPTPFAAVRKGAAVFPSSALTQAGDVVRARFQGTDADAVLRFTPDPDGIAVEVVGFTGEADELRFVQILPSISENLGTLLNVRWNHTFSVCVLGLSDRVHGVADSNGFLTAAVEPELGIVGGKAEIVAVPTSAFLSTVREVERRQGLPSPTIGGEWAKSSRAVRSSYLFTDMTEANADETIRLAKLGGFGAIMIYAGTWSASTGSYPINLKSFPGGEASLKAVIDKCHAAGLTVGMHVLTGLIAKSDPLVTPRPDPRLLKDNEATLAADIDSRAAVIAAREALSTFPGQASFYGVTGGGLDIQIDDELIEYRTIGGPGDRAFLRCTRGAEGTRAAPHAAGARIYHLCERLGHFLVDLRTSLKDEVGARIADVFDRCGFDMIDFDGGELAPGVPSWYWGSQQQTATFRRIRRDVLVQGSGITQWLWHLFARETCDDFAAVAVKDFLDDHKIADLWSYYRRNFLPAELGWWGFLSWDPARRATTPDQVEFYAARMVALDAPVSVETTLSDLQRNGRAEEMLGLLGEFERLRLSGRVPPALRTAMRSGEWHLLRDGAHRALAPAHYQTVFATSPGSVAIENRFAAQPLKFRLEAAPLLSAPGDRANLVLFRGRQPITLKWVAGSAMPGALGARIEVGSDAGAASPFIVGAAPRPGAATGARSLDLVTHRALAVTLSVEGPPPSGSELPPVVNIQLEATGMMYRDYDVDLDWRGERTVVIPEPTTARTLTEFRPVPANYRFKAAMYQFDYGKVVAVNFRWMRQAGSAAVACRVVSVEALAETPAPLESATIGIGGSDLGIPATIGAGDYAEYWGEGPVRVYDHNGVELLEVNPTGSVPLLPPGASRVAVRSRGGARVRLTAITLGQAQPLDDVPPQGVAHR